MSLKNAKMKSLLDKIEEKEVKEEVKEIENVVGEKVVIKKSSKKK